jgi:flavodoxin
MKRLTTFCFMITTVILMFSGCSKAQETQQKKDGFLTDKNVLIVYLSRTKNTKAVATIIHKNTGGSLVELELENPYPEDYKAIVSQVARENETGFLPLLKTKIDHVEKYDIVFVGFPTWGMQLPPPMKSFLKQYNLSGKIIIPFNTNAGYGIGSSFQTVKELCPKSTVLEGFSTKGGIERDGILFVMEGEKEKQVQIEVQNWLKEIGLVN